MLRGKLALIPVTGTAWISAKGRTGIIPGEICEIHAPFNNLQTVADVCGIKNGASEWTRTTDPHHVKVVL